MLGKYKQEEISEKDLKIRKSGIQNTLFLKLIEKRHLF